MYNTRVLIQSPHPLAPLIAGITADMRAQQADHVARSGLLAPLHALIFATLARIFASLGDLFDLWRSGRLPPCPAPAPRPSPAANQRTPAPAPCRRPRTRYRPISAPARPRPSAVPLGTNSPASSPPRPHAAPIRKPQRATRTARHTPIFAKRPPKNPPPHAHIITIS